MKASSGLSFRLWRFILVALFTVPYSSAQASTAAQPLKFEVVSIKTVGPTQAVGLRGGCRGIDSIYSAAEERHGGIPPIGRCVITNARLTHLIGIAFGFSMKALDTRLDWIQRGDLRFDVQAKAENPATATHQQLLTMLQNLLIERFQIRFHYVTKEEPGFALVLAKSGPKMHTSASEEEKKVTFLGSNGEELPLQLDPGNLLSLPYHDANSAKPVLNAVSAVKATRYSISALKDLVAFVGRLGPGVDETGLLGEYDFTLSWNEGNGPTLISAVRDQLGLEVRPRRVSVIRFVLDSAQMPTPN